MNEDNLFKNIWVNNLIFSKFWDICYVMSISIDLDKY